LVSIGECHYCHGVVFNFRVEQLDLYTEVSPQDIRKIRKMVSEGADLDGLLAEFEELLVEEFDYSVCEKCGLESSSPAHHVGA